MIIHLKFLISVFPIVFMIHDFEEIIFFKAWFSKNKDLLQTKFPNLSKRIIPHLETLSTAGFSLAVAEEFILLSAITYASIWLNTYFLWFAIFMAFSIHLIGHLIQWLIFQKYIPSIVTTIFCLPYCIYTAYLFLSTDVMSVMQAIGWTIGGLVLMVVNLLLAHRLAILFEAGKKRLQ